MQQLFCLLLVSLSLHFCFAQQATPLLQNVYNRKTTSLNGEWKYIVDPYENGFYNYRYEPFENQTNPWKSAFFLNSKVEDKTELLEYNFDTSDNIKVPSDWNTQKENLFYYEGTIWYKKSFNYASAEANKRVFLSLIHI